MKRYEFESFLKSFLIFFILLEILLAINFWHEYHVKLQEIEEKIQIEMKLCAYTVRCEGLKTDFVEKDDTKEENILYKAGDFFGYFAIPSVEKFLMKVTFPRSKYDKQVAKLKEKIVRKFFLYSIFAVLVSLLFSVYALLPLQKALRLNEEFVKDILHDFNTPISSMRINLKLFKKEVGDNPKIQRLENNIESILSLQHNLEVFLKGIATQAEELELRALVLERIPYFEVLYPNIKYSVDMAALKVKTNRDAFVRILDNLLSNAGKYNKADGKVLVKLQEGTLHIIDTGKGIDKPSKVFSRFYKEQDRGLGIGLHIVKKLCDELGIGIAVRSKKGRGTTVSLDLRKVAL